MHSSESFLIFLFLNYLFFYPTTSHFFFNQCFSLSWNDPKLVGMFLSNVQWHVPSQVSANHPCAVHKPTQFPQSLPIGDVRAESTQKGGLWWPWEEAYFHFSITLCQERKDKPGQTALIAADTKSEPLTPHHLPRHTL